MSYDSLFSAASQSHVMANTVSITQNGESVKEYGTSLETFLQNFEEEVDYLLQAGMSGDFVGPMKTNYAAIQDDLHKAASKIQALGDAIVSTATNYDTASENVADSAPAGNAQ